MSRMFACLALLTLSQLCVAQAGTSSPTRPITVELAGAQFETYRLWSGRAPDAKSDSADETPTLTVARPQNGRSNGTAIVIAPGGAYIGLASMLEGVEPAAWFTSRDVTAFILKYRVGPTARLPIPLQDGARAIQFVRANAKQFNIDPTRIGMMGFSAGGHLAATTTVDATTGKADATDPLERVSSRPDFLVLVYPWLEGMQLRADGTSSYCYFADLRGGGPPCQPSAYARFHPVEHVTAAMPPTFLFHTTDDELVPVTGTVKFYAALVDHGVAAELHAFASGAHGSGFGGRSPTLVRWPELLDSWLRSKGLLDSSTTATHQ